MQAQYKVRGLTRNNSSDKAKALSDNDVEMFATDLGDKSLLETTFADVHIIFIVSDYWGTIGALASSAGPDWRESLYLQAAEIEKKQLMNALDASVANWFKKQDWRFVSSVV